MTKPQIPALDSADCHSNRGVPPGRSRSSRRGRWWPVILACVAMPWSVPRAAGQLERETWWTSVDGVTIWAHLAGCDEGHVMLVRNGRNYRVPLHRLAPESVLKARKMLGVGRPRRPAPAIAARQSGRPERTAVTEAAVGAAQAVAAWASVAAVDVVAHPEVGRAEAEAIMLGREPALPGLEIHVVSAAPAVAAEAPLPVAPQAIESAGVHTAAGGPPPVAGIELCGPPVLAGGGGWKVPWEDRLDDSVSAAGAECPLPKTSLPVDPGAAGYAAVLPPRDSLPLPAPQLPAELPPGVEIRLVGRVARGSAQLPSLVQAAIAAANRLQNKPYRWGGGHGRIDDSGYDCSGSVSYVLIKAGLLTTPMPSGRFTRYGLPGRGRWITIYARNGHAFMTICGLRLDTGGSGGRGESGPRWRRDPRSSAGFVMRHPPGF